MPKSLLILNRKSCAREDVRDVVKAMQDTHNLDVIIPWRGKDLRKAVRQAIRSGVNRIVAGGGDGTLNKVANAILRVEGFADVTMGLVPLGTANDFARSYGDRGQDLAQSLKVALTAPGRQIDVGYVNDRPFLNTATGGFGAMITATTPVGIKKKLGGLAYTLSGLARLGELDPIQAHITLDDRAQVDVSLCALAIGNNRYAGGGFDIAPEADLTDGLLEFAVISPDALASGLGHWERLAEGSADQMKEMVMSSRFRTAHIETDSPFHINLDGEPMVSETFDIRVEPGQLRFAWPD